MSATESVSKALAELAKTDVNPCGLSGISHMRAVLQAAPDLVAENETLRAALEHVQAAQSIGTARVIADAALAARGGDATFDPGSYDNAVRGVGRRSGDAT